MKIHDANGEAVQQEAKRRARIVDRYNAIERPDVDDDTAAAAELGLSVDSFLRLAAVRRRHRSETLMVGRTAALERDGVAERALVMAATIELDLVRPERRDEILRKIRIIQRHIAAIELGEGDEKAAAKEMGVTIAHFRVLVRTWMLQARAEALPGATRRGTSWRRRPSHARRQELLRAALADAVPDAPLRTVYDAFAVACRDEDLKPLSLPRFYAIVQDLRNGDKQS